MALPNPSLVFTPFDPLPASDLNKLEANDQALAAGTGFNTGAIPTAALADGSVTFAKTSGIWWQELARTTLAAPADTITVNSIPARKYLKVFIFLIPTGGTINSSTRFNNDSGTNYAFRYSQNGAADSTIPSTTSVATDNQVAATRIYTTMDIVNLSAQEKGIIGATSDANTIGAANVPLRREFAAKWSNVSTQITRIDTINSTGTGDYAIGSEIVVLGHD